MAAFSDVEAEQPGFAARVRTVFDAHRHRILAMLRVASPRPPANPPDGGYDLFASTSSRWC